MPGDSHDYSPEFDEDHRRMEHINLQPPRNDNRDEESDRIRRMNGGGGLGGEV